MEANTRSVLSLFWALVFMFLTCSLKVPIASKVSPRIVGVCVCVRFSVKWPLNPLLSGVIKVIDNLLVET